MNTRLFESKMKLNGDTLETLAAFLGISRSSLGQKKNGRAIFNAEEIRAIKGKYNLTAEEVDTIFFE